MFLHFPLSLSISEPEGVSNRLRVEAQESAGGYRRGKDCKHAIATSLISLSSHGVGKAAEKVLSERDRREQFTTCNGHFPFGNCQCRGHNIYTSVSGGG